ncbi:MAG: hypothetical protein EBT86_09620 [Actinobacteria bacterium]|nr:hypothetical protein [Actinomycetota bacterium]
MEIAWHTFIYSLYPTIVYHVNGEYSTLKAANMAGYLDYDLASLELMQCFRRAGADGFLIYCALDIANRPNA